MIFTGSSTPLLSGMSSLIKQRKTYSTAAVTMRARFCVCQIRCQNRTGSREIHFCLVALDRDGHTDWRAVVEAIGVEKTARTEGRRVMSDK